MESTEVHFLGCVKLNGYGGGRTKWEPAMGKAEDKMGTIYTMRGRKKWESTMRGRGGRKTNSVGQIYTPAMH